jgi:hypothetical protein
MTRIYATLVYATLGAMLLIAPAIAWSQEAVRSFNFSTMDLDAGEFAFNFETQQIERMSRGADITFYPDDPGERPMRLRARDISFGWQSRESNEPSSMLLEGNVIISHPRGEIRAARADWDVATSVMIFTGSPSITSDQRGTLTGERMELNLQTGEFRGVNIRGENVPIRGSGADAPPAGAQNLLSTAAVDDWPALLTAIRQDSQREGPSPGRRILSLMTPQVRAGFDNLADATELAEGQKRLVTDALNGLLSSPRLYDAESWEGLEVAPGILTAAQAPELPEAERVMVNRALLHAAYPDFIGPHTPVEGAP